MKTKMLVTILAVLFLASPALFAAEGDRPAHGPKDKPAARAAQAPKLNRQQRLERWMAQINKAYEAKDYQKMEQMIRQYANARQNRPGPAAGQRQMHQRRMNQQDRHFAQGQGRQGPGRQANALQPGAQALRRGQGRGQAQGPRQAQAQARHLDRPMAQRPQWAQKQMQQARQGNFRQQLKRWALNHPQAFRQFLNQYGNKPGRWNQQAHARPQRNRPNPGYWRNFWADEF